VQETRAVVCVGEIRTSLLQDKRSVEERKEEGREAREKSGFMSLMEVNDVLARANSNGAVRRQVGGD